MDQILQILSGNARMDVEKMAVMLDLPAEEVQARISEYERQGVIRGYKPLLDYDKIDTELVEEFLAAFTREAALTLHVRQLDGTNSHHIIEAVFKGLARARRTFAAGAAPMTAPTSIRLAA